MFVSGVNLQIEFLGQVHFMEALRIKILDLTSWSTACLANAMAPETTFQCASTRGTSIFPNCDVTQFLMTRILRTWLC